MLDAQTLVSALVTGLQANKVPFVWRYKPFEVFNRLVLKFRKAPLSDESAGYTQELLFSAANREADKRIFVDWKIVMTAFILLMSAIPSTAQLNEYIQNLRNVPAAAGSDLLSLASFLQVRAWFDVTEGAQDTTLESKRSSQKEDSDDEDDDESNLDQARIR